MFLLRSQFASGVKQFKQRQDRILFLLIGIEVGIRAFGEEVADVLVALCAHAPDAVVSLIATVPRGKYKVASVYIRTWFQNDLTFELIIHTFQNKKSSLIYQDKSIEVRTIPMLHRIPTCGFLFKEKPVPKNIRKELVEKYKIPIREIVNIKNGSDFVTDDGARIPNKELTLPSYKSRSYAYCSDTAYNESIIEYIRSVNILYHETTFTHSDADLASETFHSTTKQAAEIAKKAEVGKLLIGHYSSRYKDFDSFEKEAREVFENTVALKDGDVFSLPKIREEV